ncbi:hypothetical protein GEV33_007483 [Tenebrio molitor]|uniref:Uncharacterized protein n=1 Tax=Tenebrio molitor TaxID=7067 RepID=A0A8J6HJ53_TENMO|nr:hypothetical protein GEV33_007483 [Tenebrio molitor]
MPHLFDFRGRSFALTNRGGLGPSRLPNDGGARGGRDDRIALGASVGGRTPPINHNDHRLRSGVRWSKSDEINPSSEESYFGRICRDVRNGVRTPETRKQLNNAGQMHADTCPRRRPH